MLKVILNEMRDVEWDAGWEETRQMDGKRPGKMMGGMTVSEGDTHRDSLGRCGYNCN